MAKKNNEPSNPMNSGDFTTDLPPAGNAGIGMSFDAELAELKTDLSFEAELAELNAKEGQAPATFDKKGGDLVGFWDFNLSAIRGIPRSVKLFDGNIEPKKPSILVTFELTRKAAVRPSKDEDDKDAKPFMAKPGDLVGVWYKPGMKAIRDLCGTECWMKLKGEKDTGKPNPMKTFDVNWAVNGTRIPVTEDTRKQSRPYQGRDGEWIGLTDFDTVRAPTQAEAAPNGQSVARGPF